MMIQIPVPRRGGPGKEGPLPYRCCLNKVSECALCVNHLEILLSSRRKKKRWIKSKVFSAASCSGGTCHFLDQKGEKKDISDKIVLVFSLCFFCFCLPRYFSHTPVALHTNFPDFTQLSNPLFSCKYTL